MADAATAAPIDTLPSALLRFGSVEDELHGRNPVLCLDFDGTLSPIVAEPSAARLLEGVEGVLKALAAAVPVFILSGRDAGDVRDRVHLPGILYAGSHGFEVMRWDGTRHPHDEALPYLPHLEAAERELRAATAAIPGVALERKRFTLAIHDRLVADEDLEALYRIVAQVSAEFPTLRSMRGKRVTEFLPNVDWNKGRALLWLLDMVGYDDATQMPICIGDDITDEDALRAVRGRGIGIVVGSGERYSAASYSLRDPVEVWEFLGRLQRLVREQASA
jgi:alpha,alpha-trehalase